MPLLFCPQPTTRCCPRYLDCTSAVSSLANHSMVPLDIPALPLPVCFGQQLVVAPDISTVPLLSRPWPTTRWCPKIFQLCLYWSALANFSQLCPCSSSTALPMANHLMVSQVSLFWSVLSQPPDDVPALSLLFCLWLIT